MQSYTWAEMLENAAQLAGGRRPERITVASWREDTVASPSASGLGNAGPGSSPRPGAPVEDAGLG
jgi:hypothetical protein